MAGDIVIKAEGLTKRYGANLAVDHVDFEVSAGEIVGILGPNGSGKTTTILMLLGLTEPSGGHAEVAGLRPAARAARGQAPGRLPARPDRLLRQPLGARQSRLYRPARRAVAPRDRRALSPPRSTGSGSAMSRWRGSATFSQGMRQRLGLAEILMKRPSVAILDEPTTALDPHSTQEFLDMIRGLKADGTAVLLSSHHLDQVQSVCDRVALFNRGRIALSGTVTELAGQVLGGGYVIDVEARGTDVGRAPRRDPRRRAGAAARRRTGSERYRVDCQRDLRAEIARHLAADVELIGIHFAAPSLNEVYTRYFEEARDAAQ